MTAKGGGYFFTHDGFGIVIDPGYDFVENFINCKYIGNKTLRINHIDAIIVTHAHNDHYGELDSLQNIIYQFNNRIKKRIEISSLIKRVLEIYKNPISANDKGYLIELIHNTIKERPHFKAAKFAIECLKKGKFTDPMKVNVLEKFVQKDNSEAPKKIKLIVSRSAFKSIDGLIPIKKSCFEEIHILNPGNTCQLGSASVYATRSKHLDLYSDRHSIGLRLTFEINGSPMMVGFTGDTGYFSGIEESFNKCDVLIPHLGSIKPKELEIYKNKKRESKKIPAEKEELNSKLHMNYIIPQFDQIIETAFYENHLGILGLSTLLACIKARSDNNLKLVVISEYGEETAEFRDTISFILNKIFKNSLRPVNILTGDIGLKIDLKKVQNGTLIVKERKETHNRISYTYR